MSITELKDHPALLRMRKRIENPPEQINNSSLPAGSPMYFYCRICGHQSDVKGESYTSPPRKYCKDCGEYRECNPGFTDTTIKEAALRAE